MNKGPVLFDRARNPFATGVARYFDADTMNRQPPRVVVQVQPRPLTNHILAILDTAAPWCILRPQIGDLIADELEAIPGRVKLSSRLGVFEGRLYRGSLTLLAQQGESLDLEVTFFISPSLTGQQLCRI